MDIYTLWNSFRKDDKEAGKLNGRIFCITQDKNSKRLTFSDPISNHIIHQSNPVLRFETDPAGVRHFVTEGTYGQIVYSIVKLQKILPTIITVDTIVTNGVEGEPI